ncbi:hypothetical protein SAXI111661_02300 [Saccharomonospora xinjiangensis]|nr:hypothetical protein EYD13_18420 [Saccharomonospora xinjiangensis]
MLLEKNCGHILLWRSGDTLSLLRILSMRLHSRNKKLSP